MSEEILLKKISHDDFKTFAKEQLSKEGFYKSIFTIALLITSLSFFTSLGYVGALFFLKGIISYPIQLLTGIIFSFTILIIAHEILHGIAYKLVGAKRVYFGAMISKFTFYAGSDEEKFNGKKFRFVALFPFVSILFLGLICLVVLPELFLFTTTILFLHTLFCMGDFAVLNYVQQYDLTQIYTYDSREKRETYFYLNR